MAARGAQATADEDEAQVGSRNEVLLVGRVAAVPEERELPSGDALMTWRMVVERAVTRKLPEGVRSPSVDTFDCVAWTPALRRTAEGLQDGDVVEVHGALRRRFWRAGPAAVSRCEVEVSALRRLSRRPRAQD